MKTMKITAFFVLLTVLSLGRVLAQSEIKEQMVIPLSEPGKACKIVAHVLHGSLKVVGYEGKDVVIDVTTDGNHRHESSGNGGGMHRISGSNAGGDVTAEEDNNTVTISTGLSHFSLIEVKVPQTAGSKLNIGTVNEGSIIVENTSGEMEVSNVNGPITLTNVAGSVVANTVNGDVVVGFKSIDPQAAMGFSTLNGKIDVTFPASYKANVKLKAERGDIFSDYDVEVTKSQPNVNKSTEGHMYRINIDEWVYGKINGGGPELMMKTTFGSIYIRKAK
jgi:hypothetical protein